MIISLAKRLEFYPIFGKIKKGLMSETQIPSKNRNYIRNQDGYTSESFL